MDTHKLRWFLFEMQPFLMPLSKTTCLRQSTPVQRARQLKFLDKAMATASKKAGWFIGAHSSPLSAHADLLTHTRTCSALDPCRTCLT